MTLAMHDRGYFSWPEWALMLAEALKEQPPTPAPEDDYYHAWLTALERLLAAKGLVGEAERQAREAAWDMAARATPHGQPIVLQAGSGQAVMDQLEPGQQDEDVA